LLVEQEDIDGARTQFKRLLKAAPKDADTLFALGILALQAEQSEEAQEYLQRLYSTGEHRDEAAYYLGQIYESSDDAEQALNWYQRVEGGNLFEAHIYAKQGEVSRAREILQQLRGHIGEEVPRLYLIESEILRDIGHYQAAIDVLNTALVSNPDDPELLYARALTAVNIDRIDILESDLLKLLEQDPEHADALNALGYTLADQTDRYAEALAYIERAIKLKPDSPAIMDSMGWVQYRMGNKQEALRYLWRALELLPDAEIAAHLGEVLWEQGEHQRAREVWRQALEKEPDSKYLLKMLQRYGKSFSDDGI
jgi:tetratricopeptide (TPR) repeat protein